MNKKFQKWVLFVTLASLSSLLWLQACSCGPQGNKEAGQACKESGECQTGLICNDGTCQDAIAPPDARAPIANAGNDLTVKTGQKAELTGSKSQSLEGKDLSYTWSIKEKPKGSKAKISDGDKESASLTPDIEGTYTIQLVVEDGKESEPDTVIITAEKDNQAPKADAGSNSRIELDQTVTLDASKSSDPNGDKLNFKWELAAKPDGSNASFGDNVAEKTTIKPDKVGNYAIRLTVDDGDLQDTATIFVEVVENNPEPEITKIAPAWGPTNAKDYPVTIEGKNFLFGVKVTLDGKEATELRYKGDSMLVATFDLSGVSAGTYELIAKNPDNKESNKAKFEVKDSGAPEVTKVTPSLVITGQSIQFTVEGKGFIDGATVSFDSKELATTYTSETKLLANLDKAPVTGEYELFVTNPGGKKSSAVKVLVTGVQAIISDISLTRVGSDCKQESIKVTGKNFLPDLTAELVSKNDNTKKYPAKNIKLNSINEVELEYDFTQVPQGQYDLYITNKGTNQGLPAALTVTAPLGKPEIISVYPKQVFLGGKSNIILAGINFDKSTRVDINGAIEPSMQINETTYQLPIDTSKQAAAGKLKITLLASCGRKSDPIEIDVVEEGTPKLNAALPSQMEDGKQVDVTLKGEGFGLAPKVYIDGKAIQDAVRRNEFEIVIPKANFGNKAKYKIYVENKGGKKSNEVLVEVTDPTPMKITELSNSSLFYLIGKGLRSDEDPGKATKAKPFMVFLETATKKEACKTGGVQASDSSTKDRIFISDPTTSTSTCPLGVLKAGTTYTIFVKKNVGGKDIFSNRITWTPSSSSGSSTNTPYMTALKVSAFAAPPNQTIEFQARGRYLNGSTKDPITVYVNGKKTDATTDTNFKISYSSATSSYAYVTITLSKPAVGVYAIELEKKTGKTNTLFLNVDAAETPRIKRVGSDTTTVGRAIFEKGSSQSFYLAGDYIVRKNFDWYIGGKKYTSSSSTKYLYQYLSSSDVNKLQVGEIKAYGEHKTTKKKTNEVSFRMIEKGDWGKTPLTFRGIFESAGAYPGENLKLRLYHTGFIAEDKNGKKGEVLVDGNTITDFTPTAATSSRYGYVTLKGLQVASTPFVHQIQLKNPDGTKSETVILSVRAQNTLLLQDLDSPNLYSNIIRTGQNNVVDLNTQGSTTNTKVFFAGRQMKVNKNTGGTLEVTLDATNLPVGKYPLWLWDKDKGASNSIIITVAPENGTGAVPKFYNVFPIALKGGTALSALGGKVRFLIYGDTLANDLSLVIGTKSFPIKVIVGDDYAIAEADLSGVAAGKYDMFLQGAKKIYKSPTLKLDVQ